MQDHCSNRLLRNLFEVVVAHAQPSCFLVQHLPPRPQGKIIVIGAGKAAASMAVAVEDHYDGQVEGVVVTRYGYSLPTKHIKIIEASHPVPDENSIRAADAISQAVLSAKPNDMVLCLISGGGSSLLCSPLPGLTLENKQNVNNQLLKCGASISEMNCVRKHLSNIKGGRLATLNPAAPMLSLIMSDVPGDAASEIASGPTVPDTTSAKDALAIVQKYSLELPVAVMDALYSGNCEPPKAGDLRFSRVKNKVVLTPNMALEAAIKHARTSGYDVIYLGDDLEDDATELGRKHGMLTLALSDARNKVCIISGGETSVQVKGRGRGGRNSQYLLSLALTLNGAPGIHALAADTDGIDGTQDNAGAFISPNFMELARVADINVAAMLEANDAYSAFAATDSLLMTGPTMTNVNDFRAILIEHDT